MSYNGSGVFTANSTGLPVVTGTTISSTMFNAFTADVATGLSTAVCKDGQQICTARVPFVDGISLFGVNLDGTTGSSQIGYIEGGAGAIATNLQTRTRQVISLKDFATGDGTTDDAAAILAALTESSQRNLFVPKSTYKAASVIAGTANSSVTGEGGQNGVPTSIISFTATPGATVGQLDFTGQDSYPSFSNVSLLHHDAATANNGIIVKLANAAYCFSYKSTYSNGNIGMQTGGYNFYGGSYYSVYSDNAAYGFHAAAGSTLNGRTFIGDQFSRSLIGLYGEVVGAGATLIGTYHESNTAYGRRVDSFNYWNEIGSHSELNTTYDGTFGNAYPYNHSLINRFGNYHEAVGGTGNPRLRVSLARLNIVGDYLGSPDSTAPIAFDQAQLSTPSVFIGVHTQSQYVTNTAHDPGHFVINPKSPIMLPSFGSPTGFMARAGTTFFNTDPTTMATIWGWRVLTSGWLGTPPAIGPLGKAVQNSSVLTVSTTTAWMFGEGDEISLVGTTWGSGDASAMVLYAKPNGGVGGLPCCIMNKSADSNVSVAAALSYPQATLQVIPAPGTTVGLATATKSGAGLTVASGATVNLCQLTIPNARQVSVVVEGTMGDNGTTNTCTSKTSRVVYTTDGAGTVSFSAATDYGSAVGTGGALAYTIMGASSGVNSATIQVTQVTGNSLLFGWSVWVQGNNDLIVLG